MSHLTEIDNSGSVIFGQARSEYVYKTFLHALKKNIADDLLRSKNETIVSIDRFNYSRKNRTGCLFLWLWCRYNKCNCYLVHFKFLEFPFLRSLIIIP